ncbi:MAG: SufD family Fe-S cluster assembly protein [Clostridia bacterium]|nr:SufD family Fe-S cluster assembly protein [Clostridia bacterium]
MQELSINPIPSPTWNRLNVNSSPIRISDTFCLPDRAICVEGSLLPSREKLNTISTSGGTSFDTWLETISPAAESFTVPAGSSALLRDDLVADASSIIRRVDIHAMPGSRVTIIVRQLAEERSDADIIQSYRIQADSGSEIQFVQIADGTPRNRIITALGIQAEENVGIHAIQLILQGSDIYTGGRIELAGPSSRLSCKIAYQCDEDQLLDINWSVPHRGEKTESQITASGILRGRSRKTFRGTIDFRRSSTGASGNVSEDVLLLSDDAQNQTVPVILCQEEDVAGSHGASIGRLSEEMLYYMQSRGLSESEIIQILSRSRLASVIPLVPDEPTRAWLTQRLAIDA